MSGVANAAMAHPMSSAAYGYSHQPRSGSMDHGTAGHFRSYPTSQGHPHNPSSACSRRPEERYRRAEAGAVGDPRSSDKVKMTWQPCTNGNGLNLFVLNGRTNRQHAVASRPAVLRLPPSGTWNPNTTYQLRRWVSTAYYEETDTTPQSRSATQTMLPPSPPRTMPVQLDTFQDPSGSSWWTNLEVWVEGLSKPSKASAMRTAIASTHRAAAMTQPTTSLRGRAGTLVTLHRAPDKGFGVGFRRSAAGLLVVSSLDPTVNMRSSCALHVNDVITAINGVTISPRHDVDKLLRGCGAIARFELGEPAVYSTPAPVEVAGKVDLVTMLTMFNEVEAANGHGAAEARRGAVPTRTMSHAPAVPTGTHTSSVEWLSLLVRGWSLPRGGGPR